MTRSSSSKADQRLLYLRLLFDRKKLLWKDFLVPSSFQLATFVEVLLEPVGCEETMEKIKLGLHEALVNAVKHGNSGDPNKSLRVRRILSPKWFIWQIQDEGKGLPDSEREGSLPPEVQSDRGRGLFLIHQCFDDVRWSRRGNRLQLACRRKKLFNAEDNQDPLNLLYAI